MVSLANFNQIVDLYSYRKTVYQHVLEFGYFFNNSKLVRLQSQRFEANFSETLLRLNLLFENVLQAPQVLRENFPKHRGLEPGDSQHNIEHFEFDFVTKVTLEQSVDNYENYFWVLVHGRQQVFQKIEILRFVRPVRIIVRKG